MMKISIIDNCVLNNGIEIFRFQYHIKDYLEIDKKIIVLINWSEKFVLDENIFCINEFGEKLWQIEKTEHFFQGSPYTNIIFDKNDNSCFKSYNQDGFMYKIDISTGRIIDKEFLK